MEQSMALMMKPQTFQEAMAFCKMLADSDVVPDIYRGKPGNVMAAVQMGAELGMSPIVSLNTLFPIGGKLAMPVTAMLAMVERSGLLESHEVHYDADRVSATATVTRKGRNPYTFTFTKEDAARVRVKENGEWKPMSELARYRQWPQRMYQHRALGFALQDQFPDVLKGMVTEEYAEEVAATRPETAKDVATVERENLAPEMQAKLSEAFDACHVPTAQRRVLLAQYRDREDDLMDYLRDEYAVRNGVKKRPKPLGAPETKPAAPTETKPEVPTPPDVTPPVAARAQTATTTDLLNATVPPEVVADQMLQLPDLKELFG